VDAALHALDLGLSPTAAALAARATAPAWGLLEARTLADEQQRLGAALQELATIQPAGELSGAGLAELVAVLRRRLDFLNSLSPAALAAPRESAPAWREPQPIPPRPSMQEFLTENGILVLSYVGAFLLIVATLLFEIYGTSGSDGGLQLGACWH
jgi:hypothetical protein